MGTDRQFRKLCKVLNLDKLSSDPHLKTNVGRIEQHDFLNNALAQRIKAAMSRNLMDNLNNLSVPCSLINAIDEVLNLNESREMLLSSSEAKSLIEGIGNIAFNLGLKRCTNEMTPPPSFGEHSSDILSEALDYSDEEIKTE